MLANHINQTLFPATVTTHALDNFSTTIGVSSSADMRVPAAASGRRTYLHIDQEVMGVEQILGPGVVVLQRGVLGTRVSAHAAGATVEIVGENYGVDYG